MNGVRRLSVLTLCAMMLAGCAQAPLEYPPAQKGEVVDVYHGVEVSDPYRWLEDSDAADTRVWIDAQNELTYGFLESIPERPAIIERLTTLWNYEKYGTPKKKGERYFFSKNDGLQSQSVLYTVDTLEGEARVLLDPNTLSEDGTVALAGKSVSDDGRLLAYGLSKAGSDWQEWYVRDVDTGKDLDDHIKWVKFSSASWTADGSGFFYTRYPAPEEGAEFQAVNRFPKLCYHRLGTPQEDDRLIYERTDQPDWMVSGGVTDDGKYLVIYVSEATGRNNLLFYQELGSEGAPIVELIGEFEAKFSLIDNDGPIFWLKTDLDAPRSRVVAVDLRQPERANWREVIAQAEEPLKSVNLLNDGVFVASYLKDAHSQVRLIDLEGKSLGEVELPGVGSAWGFGGRREDTETFYMYTGLSAPATIYRYDLVSGASTVYRRPKVDFNPEDYVTKQVFYKSKDGTRVPMFIAHRKGLKLNGQNPTFLYGYGGFNISMTPYFSVSNLVWMEMGGVYVIANIRGGGEYGKEWHEAAIKLNRQKSFDDFMAAAEWLIQTKYTSPSKLAIGGGSNGGLLVAACMTQRPELFGAVLAMVPVTDMLRFDKFTIGWAWVSDFGSPDNPEEFAALHAYSPLHNLKPETAYPATLITTADHDDRVVPAHSFKFAAALQAAHGGPAPTLIRIETKAGHGAGKPTAKRIEERADLWAFLVKTLKVQK